jgi:HD-GYP domain-containing protein (c-di-GMP phosphodiesterase class II)
LVQKRGHFYFGLTGLRKDGTEFPIELSLSKWEIGIGVYFTAIIRDISQRKLSEEVIQRQVNHLSALRSIDKAIISSLDLDVTLDVFLTHVMTELHIDAASILILNKHTQTLEQVIRKGFRTSALKYTKLRLGQSNAGRAAIERKIVNIPNLNENLANFESSEQFSTEGFASYLAVPLIARGETMGVMEVFQRSRKVIKPEWMEFLQAIAYQGAIALDNSFLFNNLQRSNTDLSIAYDRTIEGWSNALGMRDKETKGHSQRVADLTIRIAEEFNIKDEQLIHIRRGALLHDIGKMSVSDSILLKPGELTDEEKIIMKRHPKHARDLLYPIEHLRPAIDIPFCHHEKWDGTGYPRGLKGEEIPLSARIFSVLDVSDALSSDRSYRSAWSEEKVADYIKSESGSRFDPRIVEVFLKIEIQDNCKELNCRRS